MEVLIELALSNSMKLSHAHGATQDGQVMVERSDRMWLAGEGNGKPLQYSCHLFLISSALSDLSTMTSPSWVAPWAWLSFIDLDKAVIRLTRFL